jgi:hypothetical protein
MFCYDNDSVSFPALQPDLKALPDRWKGVAGLPGCRCHGSALENQFKGTIVVSIQTTNERVFP